MQESDWRFARKPVWIIGHLVAAAAVVAFAAAGLWQLDRHDQRQVLNIEIDDRLAQDVVSLDEVVAQPPGSIRFRQVTASGVFDSDNEIMLVLQSLNGVSGHRVLTPLLVEGAAYQGVLIDRGWVPIELDEPGDARFAAPIGEVDVIGFVRANQTAGRRVPGDGFLTQIGRVDLDRIEAQLGYELAPVFVHLAEPLDTDLGLPRIVPLPALDPGRPHLSYAVQWFIFATVVVVGYAILMRRTSRHNDGVGSPAV